MARGSVRRERIGLRGGARLDGHGARRVECPLARVDAGAMQSLLCVTTRRQGLLRIRGRKARTRHWKAPSPPSYKVGRREIGTPSCASSRPRWKQDVIRESTPLLRSRLDAAAGSVGSSTVRRGRLVATIVRESPLLGLNLAECSR